MSEVDVNLLRKCFTTAAFSFCIIDLQSVPVHGTAAIIITPVIRKFNEYTLSNTTRVHGLVT